MKGTNHNFSLHQTSYSSSQSTEKTTNNAQNFSQNLSSTKKEASFTASTEENQLSMSQNNECLLKSKKSQMAKNEINSARKKFTEEEDKYLSKLVDEMGAKNWDLIAEKMPNRTARQCRDRYSNYLIPGFFNGEWSAEEDENLYRKYQEIGPRWTIIQKYFKNRSPNSLKNRWNYFVSRKEFIMKFHQKSFPNNYNMKYQQFYQQPSMMQSNFDNNNIQLVQYLCCYGQYPISIQPSACNFTNYGQIQTQNEMAPIISDNIKKSRVSSVSNVMKNEKLKDDDKIKKNDNKKDDFKSIDSSNDTIFQLNCNQKGSGMFEEEIDDYDSSIYGFDDSELFSF